MKTFQKYLRAAKTIRKNTLGDIINESTIKRINAPNDEFETTDDAIQFIQSLNWDDIILNGVIDPESNTEMIEPGDTVSSFEPSEWGLQDELILKRVQSLGLDYEDYMKQFNNFYKYDLKTYPKNIIITRKDKAKFTQNDLINVKAFEEIADEYFDKHYEEYTHNCVIQGNVDDRKIELVIERLEDDSDPEDKYGYTLDELQNELINMGKDLAADWQADNSDASIDEFEQFVNDAAGDAADSIYGKYSHEKDKIAFLKVSGIRDIVGWAADYIADGMLIGK